MRQKRSVALSAPPTGRAGCLGPECGSENLSQNKTTEKGGGDVASRGMVLV